MSNKFTATFHQDSGHGWYAVKRSVLAALDILGRVSPYSYQRGNTVYLEEDCDAGLFFTAVRLLGSEPIVKDAKHHDRSPIRSYDSFATDFSS